MNPGSDDVRPWVKRLGAYLRIFGKWSQSDPRTVQAMIDRAKEREAYRGH